MEKFSRYAGFLRPMIFVFAFILHVVVICLFGFNQKDEPVETVDFREADVFKLVDLQEYAPPVQEAPKPPVKEKVTTVKNQPKASERIQETEDEVVVEKDNPPPAEFNESDFLPQHKISSVPVIPIREVLSKMEYPPMALRQGIEAVVYLELFIDKNGAIKNIKVLKDPGHGFAEAAVAALSGVMCIPARANEKNCAVRYRYPIKFTLS